MYIIFLVQRIFFNTCYFIYFN